MNRHNMHKHTNHKRKLFIIFLYYFAETTRYRNKNKLFSSLHASDILRFCDFLRMIPKTTKKNPKNEWHGSCRRTKTNKKIRARVQREKQRERWLLVMQFTRIILNHILRVSRITKRGKHAHTHTHSHKILSEQWLKNMFDYGILIFFSFFCSFSVYSVADTQQQQNVQPKRIENWFSGLAAAEKKR